MNGRLNYLKDKIKTYLFPAPPSAKDQALAEKIKAMDNRFKGATQFLKKTTVTIKGEKVYLHSLPWYVLIGSVGSGKTTLLANSGVKYILEKKVNKENTSVSARVEQCDWWVTSHSVIIDVPGNYVTYRAGMVSVPNKVWRHFLSLIKKRRHDHALSGVIIALSLSELMDKSSKDSLIENIHYRLTELRNKFGHDLPVYFTVTKCDLMPGFMEFFTDYGSNEVTQAWGVPLTLKEGESLPHVFSYWFNALIKRLNQQLIWRLHQEKNIYSKLYIKDFPLQLERLKEALTDLLTGLTREGKPFLLKGVYLTSGTQQQINDQSSFNRQIILSNDMHTSLTIMQAPPIPTQAYFIKQFIMQILTPESQIKAKAAWRPRNIAYAFFISVVAVGYINHFIYYTQETDRSLSGIIQASLPMTTHLAANKLSDTQGVPVNLSTNARG